MVVLAEAIPKRGRTGSLLAGTTAQDSISINQWNLEALSVNDKHISPNAITTDKIVVGAVTSTILEDGAVTTAKLNALSVTAEKIAVNAVTTDKIYALAVTSGKINVGTLSAISANMGTITAGTLNLVSGTTGIYMSPTQIYAKVSGVTKMDFNVSGGVYYVAGEIVADKITVTENAANSVTFGADITINGDILLQDSATSGYIRFDGTGGSRRIGYDSVLDAIFILNSNSTGEVLLQVSSSTAYAGNFLQVDNTEIELNTNAGGSTTSDIVLRIGSNAGNRMRFYRSATEVMWFDGNSSIVHFASYIYVEGGTLALNSAGSRYFYLSGNDVYWWDGTVGTKLN